MCRPVCRRGGAVRCRTAAKKGNSSSRTGLRVGASRCQRKRPTHEDTWCQYFSCPDRGATKAQFSPGLSTVALPRTVGFRWYPYAITHPSSYAWAWLTLCRCSPSPARPSRRACSLIAQIAHCSPVPLTGQQHNTHPVLWPVLPPRSMPRHHDPAPAPPIPVNHASAFPKHERARAHSCAQYS